MTLFETWSISRSSMRTRKRLLRCPKKVAIAPQAKATVAPSGLSDRLTRSATSPVRPALEMLQKRRDSSPPPWAV